MIEMLKNKTLLLEEINRLKQENDLLRSQGQANTLVNNFYEQKIINICFKIDSQSPLSIPALPSDRLKDLFLSALQRNNFSVIGISGFTFFYNSKNVTGYFSNNKTITSLNLTNNAIINVHT